MSVAAAAGGDEPRLHADPREGVGRRLHRRRRPGEPVGAELLLDPELEVTLRVARPGGERVHDLAHEVAGAIVVEAPRLELDRAALRDDVRGRPAVDPADVGRRPLVDAPEPQ